jgi:hypothetical protein
MTRTPLVALGLLLAACGGKTSSPVGNNGGGDVDRAARAFDWKNRTYAIGDARYAVVNGRSEFVFDADGAMTTRDAVRARGGVIDGDGALELGEAAFTDVDHDGREDAVIPIELYTGGSGRFTDVWVFRLVDGAPALLGVVPGGDRADGGLAHTAVDADGTIRVVRNIAGEGACCPTATRDERWRWNGRALSQL